MGRYKEADNRFKYGFATGAVSGLVLSIPSYIKTRSILTVVATSVTMGFFFGGLVTVSTVIGRLESDDLQCPKPTLHLKTIDSEGNFKTSQQPIWMDSQL